MIRWLALFYPLAELWSLIELGARTSASTALLCVVIAGFMGVIAIRFAGTQVLARLRAAQQARALQQNLVAGDMAMAVAGLLLIIPGLVSDAAALLLVIRPFRSLLVRLLGTRVVGNYREFSYIHTPHNGAHRDTPSGAPFEGEAAGVTLEGEYRELDDGREQLECHEEDQTGPH